MPAFCFPLPRFLHFCRLRRSRSLDAPLTGPSDDIASSHSPHPSPSPVPSPRASSTRRILEQASHVATGNSRPLTPSDLTSPQIYADVGGEDRLTGNTSRAPSQVSQTIMPVNVIEPISAPEPTTQDLVAKSPAHLSHLPNTSTQSVLPSRSLVAVSQQSIGSEHQDATPGPLPQHSTQENFKDAHDFTMLGANFIDNNKGNVTLTNNFHMSINFMEKLLERTIRGAASDSSDRYPPPRCHPGTRLDILARCLYFIAHCSSQQKMRWVVGAAGVGKSAIMQSVADSPQLQVAFKVSVFFSINGRDDGTKTIITISYQLATKSRVYRRFIEDKIIHEPSLLDSSMPVQFEKLIIDPFIRDHNLKSAGRVLIIIDGLDECKLTNTQVELLRLISTFCISYPSSPIVWLIASRPEPHITSFFSRLEVAAAYEKEEIAVDSDQARADVETYLRDELTEIRKASDFLGLEWPDEQHLWKLASAAGGLFAYAQTAVRYIGDPDIGDPVTQLSDVLNVIDELPLHNVPLDQHPMALLDALYTRILSKIPPKVMINARKLLLLLASKWDLALGYTSERNFVVLCNWLGMTVDEAYAALNRLRSVLKLPARREAHLQPLEPFHKSLIDYLSRSSFSTNIRVEAQTIKTKCAFRVLNEAPGGVDPLGVDYLFLYGKLARNGGTGDQITITWQVDQKIISHVDRTLLGMYMLAIGEVAGGMERGDPVFQSEPCIRVLTTRFSSYHAGKFPYRELRDFVFDKSRCHDFMTYGILKQIPFSAIRIRAIDDDFEFKLHFYRPRSTTTLPDQWQSSCKHERMGEWGQGMAHSWTTDFDPKKCVFCFKRFQRQFENWVSWYADHAVSIMFSAAGSNCVEIRFVDSEDGESEWTYWFWLWLPENERKKLGSTI